MTGRIVIDIDRPQEVCAQMFTIECDFIGDFKIGDNIVYNLKVLNALYDGGARLNPNQRRFFYKPQIVTLVSIIEALLYDLTLRARTFTNEGVRNVPNSVLKEIRSKKQTDKLAKLIEVAKRYKLFGDKPQIYSALTELNKLRNRIHIQNAWSHQPADEEKAFDSNKVVLAERALEKIVKICSTKYNRSISHVPDFEFPWKQYYRPLDRRP